MVAALVAAAWGVGVTVVEGTVAEGMVGAEQEGEDLEAVDSEEEVRAAAA